MKNSTLSHGFADSGKDRKRDPLFIAVGWLAPIIACLAVLAIAASVFAAMLGER